MTTAAHKFKKVCILSRKSRPEETDEQIKRQLQTCVDMCISKGWDYDIVQEYASSQTIDEHDRPEFHRLLQRVSVFDYDAVVASDLDRLARHPALISKVKEIFVQSGTLFVTPTKTYDFSLPEDDFTSDLMAVLDKAEYMKIKSRLSRGMWSAAKQGKWLGVAPYGYRKDPDTKKLVIHEEEAAIVRIIFDMYTYEGYGTEQIAIKLSNEGTIFSSRAISRMLKAEYYKGTVVYGKTKKVGKKNIKRPKEEWVYKEYAHDPIVSYIQWYEAQAKMDASRVTPPAARKYTTKYSNLFKCKHCGHTMMIQVRNDKEYIRCCQTINKQGSEWKRCYNSGCPVEKIEQDILNDLKAQIASVSDLIDSLISSLSEEKNNSDSLLESYRATLDTLANKISRIQDSYDDRIYTREEAKEKIAAIRSQKDHLEDKIRLLEEQSKVSKIDKVTALKYKLEQFVEGADGYSAEDYNRILRQIIDKIEYSREGRGDVSLVIHYKE